MLSAWEAAPSTTKTNSIVAPGFRSFNASAVRTVNGITMASMKPGTFSVETNIVLLAASIFTTTPRIGCRSSAHARPPINMTTTAKPRSRLRVCRPTCDDTKIDDSKSQTRTPPVREPDLLKRIRRNLDPPTTNARPAPTCPTCLSYRLPSCPRPPSVTAFRSSFV